MEDYPFWACSFPFLAEGIVMGSFSYKRNFYFRFLPEVFFWTEAFPVNVNMTDSCFFV